MRGLVELFGGSRRKKYVENFLNGISEIPERWRAVNRDESIRGDKQPRWPVAANSRPLDAHQSNGEFAHRIRACSCDGGDAIGCLCLKSRLFVGIPRVDLR